MKRAFGLFFLCFEKGGAIFRFMQISGEGIVLKVKPQSRGSFWVCLFTKQFGKLSGMVTGGSKRLGDLQIGNVVEFEHSRRLESQLGSFQFDVLSVPSSKVMDNPVRLQAVQYVCDLLNLSMHEGESHANLYSKTYEFLTHIERINAFEGIAFWELKFLTSIGYGLSLNDDASVREKGDNSPLVYVSPRSGRAVSELAGMPYKDKLLPFPALFGGKSKDFLDVFNLTGHFLSIALEGKVLDSRTQFIQSLTDMGLDS